MNTYKVTYFVGEEQREKTFEAEHTGDVFALLEEIEPDAHDIKIELVNS